MEKENRILIVDDTKFARSKVKKPLEQAGYANIVEAIDGTEALEFFCRDMPDLTLLDIVLQDGSDLSLLEKLLEIRPKAKIVVISALTQQRIISDALTKGAKDFLTKPFEDKDLVEIVANVLERK